MRLASAVAEERSFTRAARRCNVSQPVMTKCVQEIERELGVRIFDRRPRAIETTEAGKLFLREARKTLEQSSRAMSLVKLWAQRETRPVGVGLSTLMDLEKICAALDRAKKNLPELTLTLQIGDSPQLLLELQRGNLDLAIVDAPVKEAGLRCPTLTSEPLVAAVREDLYPVHKLRIHVQELLKLPLLLLSASVDLARMSIEQQIALAGDRAFRIHDVESLPAMFDDVVINHRVALMRQSSMRFHRQGVRFMPITEEITVTSSLIYKADNREARYKKLLDEIISAMHVG